MQNEQSKLLALSGICAIVGPILLVSMDILHLAIGQDFIWTIGMWLAFTLLAPAVLGVAYHLESSGSRIAVIGGALAFVGAVAGASMQALFRAHVVLAEQGLESVSQQLRGTLKLVMSTQTIGLTWPLGLLILSLALLSADRTKWLVALVLAAGAVAFPIGRIWSVQPAVLISGVCFVIAFGYFGKQLIGQRESP